MKRKWKLLYYSRVCIGIIVLWGIWRSYYNIPKAIFYVLQGDYHPCELDRDYGRDSRMELGVQGFELAAWVGDNVHCELRF